ncbi:unnamed protein product [Trifolium pratense]|uniref:Uncharacterized protein n=1 Tax=Trifolium pratense TaxID=57577 RepID=A0ACB0IFD0_TRIPR|nr:unnamed protein product [Trifolium pratense]
MEKGLLEKYREGGSSRITWSVFFQEVKDVGFLALPMITVTLSQYFLQIISIMMVGRLGKLALSSTAIAISLCGVTGFSLLFGMSCALETQCGQAYGAKQYRKFGVQIYTGIVSLIITCVPLTILWFYMGKLLILIGQDPLISHEAGKFVMSMIPALFAYATLQGLTRAPISMESFNGIGEFFRYAIPSAGMICLEWWSFELLIVLSGLLPNPQLETSVLSICLSIISTIYTIPEATGSAASSRVSNALGAGCAQAARLSVYAAMTVAVSEAILVSSTIFASRHILGYLFSNEQDVVDYVTNMVPLISINVIVDSLHGTLAGIARGSGWQKLGAYVNLGAYYVFGIPIAVLLGFWFELRGKGLWIGILVGAFCQAFLLALITSLTNWEKQATKARERIFEGSFAVEDRLV